MIKPIGNKVAIEVEKNEEQKTSTGLIIPEGITTGDKVAKGKVVAVGSGKVLSDGTVQPIEIEAGNTVLYPKYAGNEVQLVDDDNKVFNIIDADQILGIVEE